MWKSVLPFLFQRLVYIASLWAEEASVSMSWGVYNVLLSYVWGCVWFAVRVVASFREPPGFESATDLFVGFFNLLWPTSFLELVLFPSSVLPDFDFAYRRIFDLHVCCTPFPSERISPTEKRSAVVPSRFESSRHSQSLSSLYLPVSNCEKDHSFWAFSHMSFISPHSICFLATHFRQIRLVSLWNCVWDTGGGLLHIL